MKPRHLVLRSMKYYWRTNAAVVLGVATAVSVLSGALLVGDSVRGSLLDLVLERLGRTDQVVVSAGFVRENLAGDLEGDPEFSAFFDRICPIVMVQGFVSVQGGGSRAGQVLVYGVDDRFWRFHGMDTVSGPRDRDALISPALAKELGVAAGAMILVRARRPIDTPLEWLHGRKDDPGQTLRATVRGVISRRELGEFSLQARQGDIRAVFLPLSLLQRNLEVGNRVNTLLLSTNPDSTVPSPAALERLVRKQTRLEDIGLELRVPESRDAFFLEAEGGLLNDAQAKAAMDAAREARLAAEPVFTYLATGLASGNREIPYSVVTAMDLPELSGPKSMVLNDWAARDLQVASGDLVTMEYDVWEEPGRLVSRSSEFRISGVVPVDPRDRDLAPVYPGITDSATLSDWDPSFPIDLRRIRSIDEEYWKIHQATPKAFISYGVGEQLWQSRYGSMTAIRFTPNQGQDLETMRRFYAEHLREKIDPLAMGIAVRDVRAEGLRAAGGATDFGTYFLYFSFFLVVSALLLAALFFRLSMEQRAGEVGLLCAVGWNVPAVRRVFLWEGFWLSLTGAGVGVLGGVGYGWVMMTGLRTWWVGAVGTTALTLHLSPMSLAGGVLGGVAASMACVWLSLRSLSVLSERRLLTGQISSEMADVLRRRRKGGWKAIAAAGLALLGAVLIAAAAAGLIERASAFFSAGMALLASFLLFFALWLAQPARKGLVGGRSWVSLGRLGLRNVMYRPTRSLASMAMIASAIFILIAVDMFRKEDSAVPTDRRSGTGGYSLLVESLLPLVHDPGNREGREMLGLADFDQVTIEPFRVRPGDDASCLNLYVPNNPRILAPPDRFIEQGRFSFRSSLASTSSERVNPWLLLHREEDDGAVPVIADMNSMTYVLHRKLGEDVVVTVGEREVSLRLVAALKDSIFQGELLMSQTNFLRLFPEREGYQFLLVEPGSSPGSGQDESVALAIEEALTDYGADVRFTAERLSEFHQVENTYLSTFQMLGGLGLLLGTFGLGTVLLRNIMERRRELALLRALGYRRAHFFAMVIAENGVVLLSGLLMGTICAILAILPALLEQSVRLPTRSLGLLLGSVLAAGLIASLAATVVALRSPLLRALRSE